jgi:hypothetical protein
LNIDRIFNSEELNLVQDAGQVSAPEEEIGTLEE